MSVSMELKFQNNKMEYREVDSSRIEKLGYDYEKARLEVYFKNGHIYLYEQVPQNYYMECLLSESVGKYFFDNIAESFPRVQLR